MPGSPASWWPSSGYWRLEIVGSAAAVSEALAEKRRNAIEDFIRANLPTGEVVQLYPCAPPARGERAGSSKPAA